MSVLTRWRARRAARIKLRTRARASVVYWGRRAGSVHGKVMLKLARARYALRNRQVAYADRVIGRHPEKLAHAGGIGIDVSNNNGAVDFSKVAAGGYDFAYCKATEGTTFRDKYFAGNVKAANAAGMRVGGYHFLHHGNPDAQAEAFCAMVKTAHCTLRPVCDVEVAGCTEADVAAFVAGVRKRLGVTPLIYTSPAFMRWTSTHECGLWVANYGVSKPAIPAPWKSYAIWQHSSTAAVPGVNGNCDINRCPDLSKIVI